MNSLCQLHGMDWSNSRPSFLGKLEKIESHRGISQRQIGSAERRILTILLYRSLRAGGAALCGSHSGADLGPVPAVRAQDLPRPAPALREATDEVDGPARNQR